MSRIEYRHWNPKDDTLDLVQQATSIARGFIAQGYDMTVRQLYYQLVSLNVIPNTIQSYKRLASILDDARMGGGFDWSYLVDRTRNLVGNTHWNDPAQIIRATARSYMLDRWKNQRVRVEVWVEKEALSGVIGRIAGELDVDWTACRGYMSSSEMWHAAQRFGRYLDAGQRVVVLHLGDHDPSGLDMTRDNTDRLSLFTDVDWVRAHRRDFGGQDPAEVRHEVVQDAMRDRLELDAGVEPLEIRRIALNMDQVLEYDPPPNPAKFTDSRAAGYVDEHGPSSWELDALPPNVLADLIRGHVEAERDPYVWEDTIEQETDERRILQAATDRWADVVEFLNETEE